METFDPVIAELTAARERIKAQRSRFWATWFGRKDPKKEAEAALDQLISDLEKDKKTILDHIQLEYYSRCNLLMRCMFWQQNTTQKDREEYHTYTHKYPPGTFFQRSFNRSLYSADNYPILNHFLNNSFLQLENHIWSPLDKVINAIDHSCVSLPIIVPGERKNPYSDALEVSVNDLVESLTKYNYSGDSCFGERGNCYLPRMIREAGYGYSRRHMHSGLSENNPPASNLIQRLMSMAEFRDQNTLFNMMFSDGQLDIQHPDAIYKVLSFGCQIQPRLIPQLQRVITRIWDITCNGSLLLSREKYLQYASPSALLAMFQARTDILSRFKLASMMVQVEWNLLVEEVKSQGVPIAIIEALPSKLKASMVPFYSDRPLCKSYMDAQRQVTEIWAQSHAVKDEYASLVEEMMELWGVSPLVKDELYSKMKAYQESMVIFDSGYQLFEKRMAALKQAALAYNPDEDPEKKLLAFYQSILAEIIEQEPDTEVKKQATNRLIPLYCIEHARNNGSGATEKFQKITQYVTTDDIQHMPAQNLLLIGEWLGSFAKMKGAGVDPEIEKKALLFLHAAVNKGYATHIILLKGYLEIFKPSLVFDTDLNRWTKSDEKMFRDAMNLSSTPIEWQERTDDASDLSTLFVSFFRDNVPAAAAASADQTVIPPLEYSLRI
ncbi:MAG: hypothetical protein ACHP65_08515 [Legionellales bacterium]